MSTRPLMTYVRRWSNINGFGHELEYSCKRVIELLSGAKLPDELENEVKGVLGEEIPASLNFIRTSANKMEMLVKGLLKLSRLGPCRFRDRPRWT